MRFINIASAGEHPRMINAHHIMEITPWLEPKTDVPIGTKIKLACVIGKTDDGIPFLAVVETPFEEIIRRMREDFMVLLETPLAPENVSEGA